MNRINMGTISRLQIGFIILISLLSVNASQRIARFYLDEVERGDEFIDDLLKDMVYDQGHEYDPYHMEDSVVGFSKKIAFVNVSGEAKLHNGYITGLKSLHRPEHCMVREENGRLFVRADLGAGVLNFHYDGTVKFMNFGPTISVHGQLSYLEIHMEFNVDSETGRNGDLDKFLIDDMKGLKVWITGLGPMNWAANYMISAIGSLFKGYIRNMLEKQVKNHLSARLPRYQFPVSETPDTEAPEISEIQEQEASFEGILKNVETLDILQEILDTENLNDRFEY